jgi:serine/threonine protein kinase/tetratricopeptide (TPR) repeat protein
MSSEIPRSFSDGRYVVVKKLGEGGKGIVFKCSDEMLSRTVAVKMIKTSLDEETSSRFKREAQTTARLNHQNIVSVYDIGNVDNHPFLVIEYIEGKSLDDVIKEKSVLSPYDIVRISIAIAEALEYSHKQGILHRDIKPENVMISKDGIPKIMDFGLARSMDSPKLTHAGAIVGTPAFISPESALGKENDARSDLYSLGCVMYSMATGHPPFVSNDNLKLVYSHINDTPVPVRRIRHDFPEDLDNVIMKLLSKDPSSRYQSASDLLTVLRSLKYQENNSFHNVEIVSPGASGISLTGFTISSGHQRRPLVGREMETSKVRSQIDAALTGMGSMIMIVGQTGTGKTRFLEEARAYASMRGFTVISVRCSKSKSGIPGQALSDLFREYISSQPMQLVYKICGDYADQMQKIVPEIAPRLGKVPEFPGLDAEQQRARRNEAVSVFIENMSKENPLFVSFDDIQFIDSFSLTFFRYYYEFVSSQRVVFIGASIPLDENSDIMKAMGEAIKARILEIIELGNLDKESTRLLISNYLGNRPGDISDEFLNFIYAKTYGNPLFLEETLKYLIDRKQIYQKEDGTWDRDSLSTIKIPSSLKSIVRSKIEGLDEESLNLLKIASVIGQDFDYGILLKLSGMNDEDRFMSILEGLIDRRFLAERKGSIGTITLYFTDPQVREILYGDVSMMRRKKLHEKVGEVIEGMTSQEDIGGMAISSLADHFQEGGNLPKALKYRKMEADLLSSMAEFSQASRSYEKCLDIVTAMTFSDQKEKKREVATLQIKLASALRGIDQANLLKNARSAMELAKELGDDKRFIEAATFTLAADSAGALRIYEEVKKINDTEETLEAKITFLLTYASYAQIFGDINEAIRVNKILEDMVTDNKDKLSNFSNKSIIFEVEIMNLLLKEITSESDKEHVLKRMKEIIDSLPDSLKYLRAAYEDFLADYYFYLSMDLKHAKYSFDVAISISEQNGMQNLTGGGLVERIYFCSIFRDGFETSKRELEEIPKKYLVGNSGSSLELHFNTYREGILAWYHLANGNREEMLKCISSISKTVATQFILLRVMPELLFYADTDDTNGFLDALGRADGIYGDKPNLSETIIPRAFVNGTAAEVFARLGQLDKAKERLSSLKKMASSLNEMWLSACVYRAEASIAMAEKRYDESEKMLMQSINIWKDLGIRFFAGRDHLLLASSHHDAGYPGRADESLNKAMEMFTQIGATMYAQKVLSRKELLKA